MMNLRSLLESRPGLWVLASLSFVCLLCHFYGFWSMKVFTPCVLFPSTLLLIYLALTGQSNTRRIIREGALAGLFAAVIYDVFRVPFVLAGKPLFAIFPKFGQMLLYGTLATNDTGVGVQAVGWAYHFSNGAALGIMFLAMMPSRVSRTGRFAGAIAWAVGVEILLLLSPYYQFFQLKMDWAEFLWLTLSAHIVFGLALAWWCEKRLHEKASARKESLGSIH